MSIRTKEERAKIETEWGLQNNHPDAICEGYFNIWNHRKREICPCRDNCDRYNRYKNGVENLESIYDKPQVRFYYVDAFRKCNHKTFNELN